MVQFGAGADLAAQCPAAPIPDGWSPWSDENGPIPDGLAARAQAVANDATIALGATESYPLPGVTALIRVEPRVWGKDTGGNLVQGCFRVGGVFLPTETGDVTPPTTVDKTTKIIATLTVVSLVVGTAATLHSWSDK
jgi:hypothetical protein